MSEILTCYEFGNVLGRIPVCDASTEAERILRAHDAALRARVAEMEASSREITAEHEQRCAEVVGLRQRVAELEAALTPFITPESYSTAEEECRRNASMDWCAVHSFRWPCPVDKARAVLAKKEAGRGE